MFKKKILIGLLFVSIMAVTATAFAASNSSATAVNCVKAAAVVRETALGFAVADYTRSVSIAYFDRTAALQSAYAQTGDKVIKSAVKSVWTNFNTFMKSVKNKWSMAKTSAWSAYRSSAKACKSSSDIIDSSNSSSEI